MAAIIDTSHRYVGLWGTDPYGTVMDGFQTGNYAGGLLPTELSADWCNTVQQEINNAAIAGLGAALDSGDDEQLAVSIDNQNIERHPRYAFSPIVRFRTQSDAALTGTSGATSCLHQRTGYSPSLASGAVATLCSFVTPTGSQMLVTFSVTVCQTDVPAANYANVQIMASVRNNSGVVTVASTSTIFSNIGAIAYVVTVVNVGTSVVCRLTVPAVPAAKIHNATCHGTMLVVTSVP